MVNEVKKQTVKVKSIYDGEVITLYMTVNRLGQLVWVDEHNKCYGVGPELPRGYDKVVSDEEAEYWNGAKIVTGWEHNLGPYEGEWFENLHLAPAYIVAMLSKEPTGELGILISSDSQGVATHEEDVMRELFVDLIEEYTEKNQIDPYKFLDDIRKDLRVGTVLK